MFDNADYQRAAARLDAPLAHVKAMAAVESSGETFWTVGGQRLVPVRFEAHWFGQLTGYRFNATHPDLSCVDWTPALAAVTRAGAWDQVRRARDLDEDAANQATSWGAFQGMGFHWQRLGYTSITEFVFSMSVNGDDGQMDFFTRFVADDDQLLEALRTGDWETVETRYNGGGYGGAYAEKLRAAVDVYAGEEGATLAPRVLRLGDQGGDVAAMQAALGLAASGDFDQATREAVEALQESLGLLVDGVVGMMTRRALGL
ncbi:N-acetylmuramidase domain-containing protein [Reyranella sp.]|uniref:N-acetylmuramidase domain-containing protein n=1 Tax=Reyranella sp. TaxID=1929291 RepID=UPI003BA8C508